MKSGKNFLVVLVTAPNLQAARKLAQAALEARLVACVNVVPKLESHYWWQGKIESSAEVLLILKTTRSHLSELESLVLSAHPYETPEIIALPLSAGTDRYLAWVQEAVGSRANRQNA